LCKITAGALFNPFGYSGNLHTDLKKIYFFTFRKKNI